MRRPGVPQTPRSREPEDRGVPVEPRREQVRDSERRDERAGKSAAGRERAKGRSGHPAKRAGRGADRSTGRPGRSTDRPGRSTDRSGRPAGRDAQGKPPTSREVSEKRKKDAVRRDPSRYVAGGWRKYFTPRRASETFRGQDEPSEFEVRRRELRGARRKVIATRIAIALGVVAVVLGALWVVFFSPLFGLAMSKVTVSGANEQVPAEEVKSAVAPFVGMPLPRLSPDNVAQSVEKITLVQEAEVVREWPKGLDVSIKIRKPVAAVLSDGHYDIVDAEGIVIGKSPTLPKDLVNAELKVKTPQDRAKAMGRISTVISEVPKEFRDVVDTIIADPLTVEIRTVDGRIIKWGDETKSAEKAKVAMLLLEQRPAQVYDVSTPARPVTS